MLLLEPKVLLFLTALIIPSDRTPLGVNSQGEVNVTQATPETFTEDPSKLPFLYFFAFILGIEGLRMMSVQREMKTRKSAGMRNLLAQDSTLCIGQSSNAFISYVSPVYDVCTSSTMKSAPVLSVKNMKL
ncbi:microfibrillar-associated protein 5 isoform X9 [Pteropus alecto]|uniref:microfibrillar-associated protein 5 isoform X9 n=1 Tax=Pteropus alecto TaxID=9402 RepID=UPI000D53BAAD|nr:microfibrillar-associated protein 5 isoform X9 [Pteropus alecto]